MAAAGDLFFPLMSLSLPSFDDFHAHLRDGELMRCVAPLLEEAGLDCVLVMPNLVPPLTSPEMADAYRRRLQPLLPSVHLLMTLYLNKDLTAADIKRAKEMGVVGSNKLNGKRRGGKGFNCLPLF